MYPYNYLPGEVADDHTHQCRDCGAEIECPSTGDECLWEGANDGCACESVSPVSAIYSER